MDDVPLPPVEMQERMKAKAEQLIAGDEPLEKEPLFEESFNRVSADEPVDEHDSLLESAFNKTIDHDDVVNSQVAPEVPESKELFSADDVETKTDLTPQEIVAISQIKFMAEQYGIPVFHSIARNHMLLKISLLRKSRREYIEGLHATQQRQQAMGGGSAFDWIKDKLGGQ